MEDEIIGSIPYGSFSFTQVSTEKRERIYVCELYNYGLTLFWLVSFTVVGFGKKRGPNSSEK